MYHLQINCKIYNKILNKHRLKNNKSCDYHVARSPIDVALKERTLELQTSRKNVNCCIQQRNSIKMMQKSLKSKYNKLLSFRHEEVII